MGRRWAAAKAAMPRDAGSIAGSPRRSLQPQRVGGRDKLCDKVGRQERVGQRGEGGGGQHQGQAREAAGRSTDRGRAQSQGCTVGWPCGCYCWGSVVRRPQAPREHPPVMTGEMEKGRSSSEMAKVLPQKSLRARYMAACRGPCGEMILSILQRTPRRGGSAFSRCGVQAWGPAHARQRAGAGRLLGVACEAAAAALREANRHHRAAPQACRACVPGAWRPVRRLSIVTGLQRAFVGKGHSLAALRAPATPRLLGCMPK